MQGLTEIDGGYDEGYKNCPCFWGDRPGSLIQWLTTQQDFDGAKVLDIGGGEGKNAVYLAEQGAHVEIWDVSEAALSNGKHRWPDHDVVWRKKDALDLREDGRSFNLIVAYGLLHCLAEDDIDTLVVAMKRHVPIGGQVVVVTFNSRSQNIAEAHPGFEPTLLPHQRYVSLFSDWEIQFLTDSDLKESHPHNGIEHTHSMTRLVARRPADG